MATSTANAVIPAHVPVTQFCGGPGSGVPGPCPKGEHKAHVVARAHANAAKHAHGKNERALKRVEALHAKKGNEHTAASLERARANHATSKANFEKLHRMATEAKGKAKGKPTMKTTTKLKASPAGAHVARTKQLAADWKSGAASYPELVAHVAGIPEKHAVGVAQSLGLKATGPDAARRAIHSHITGKPGEYQEFSEYARFCKTGTNAGKPGPCPDSGVTAVAQQPASSPQQPSVSTATASQGGSKQPSPREQKKKAKREQKQQAAEWQSKPARQKIAHAGAVALAKAGKVGRVITLAGKEAIAKGGAVAKAAAVKGFQATVEYAQTLPATAHTYVEQMIFQMSAHAAVDPNTSLTVKASYYGMSVGISGYFALKDYLMGGKGDPGAGAKHAESDTVAKVRAIFEQIREATDGHFQFPSDEEIAAGLRGAATPHVETFAESRTLRGVEIFAAGTHRGKTYTETDLDEMVENFRQFSAGAKPAVRVPAVLGHEETQEWLERSDLPAAAWATAVYRDGKILRANFADIPRSVARLLSSKAYRTVSAEVYDEPPEGVSGKGKMLRRVAFLGGEIPQIKRLEDIPAVEEHAERSEKYRPVVLKFSEAHRRATGTFAVFAEVNTMDREQMLARLAELGFDTSVFTDATPDEALAEVLRVYEDEGDDTADEAMDGEGMGGEVAGGEGVEGDADLAGGDDEGGDEEEFADAVDENDRQAKADEASKMMDRARKMMEKYCSPDELKKMAEAGKFPDPSFPRLAGMGEIPGAAITKHPSQVTMKYAEEFRAAVKPIVDEAVAAVRKEFAPIVEQTEQLSANTKKANIEKFIESQLKAGKILPAEVDGGLVARLMRADARTVVRKFKEKGKEVAATELDMQMREIEARPVLVKFGERVASANGNGHTGGGGGGAEEEAVARVEAHYEQFSEAFNKTGTSKESLVAGFKAARKANPRITAESFLQIK